MAVKPLTGEKLEKELARLEAMTAYERSCEEKGQVFCCGIDEAGRGPLAGPVVAAAVVLPKDCRILYLNDSKKLSPKKRDMLYDEITAMEATYEAMRQAIRQLGVAPDVLLNDAVVIPGIDIQQIPIVKGDAKSVSIAAASILAKVTRDRMMEEYDRLYPQYGFGTHKGYGTAAHIRALREHGPCAIHRRTFLKNFHLEERREIAGEESAESRQML